MSNVQSGVNLVDRSGTIASGGTAQEAAAANPCRGIFIFMNVSDGDLWLDFDDVASAAQPSLKFPAGAGVVLDAKVPRGSVSVYGASTSQAYVLKEG